MTRDTGIGQPRWLAEEIYMIGSGCWPDMQERLSQGPSMRDTSMGGCGCAYGTAEHAAMGK